MLYLSVFTLASVITAQPFCEDSVTPTHRCITSNDCGSLTKNGLTYICDQNIGGFCCLQSEITDDSNENKSINNENLNVSKTISNDFNTYYNNHKTIIHGTTISIVIILFVIAIILAYRVCKKKSYSIEINEESVLNNSNHKTLTISSMQSELR